MADQFIAVREAAQMLGITEKKIMDLIDEGKLQAYRIAGQFLRLKKNEVVNVRSAGSVTVETYKFTYSAGERIKDFFYFNDFYMIAILIILSLIFYIFYLSSLQSISVNCILFF